MTRDNINILYGRVINFFYCLFVRLVNLYYNQQLRIQGRLPYFGSLPQITPTQLKVWSATDQLFFYAVISLLAIYLSFFRGPLTFWTLALEMTWHVLHLMLLLDILFSASRNTLMNSNRPYSSSLSPLCQNKRVCAKPFI